MSGGILSRGNLERTRRQQSCHALLLLTLAGAVRPADVVVYYRGADRLLKTWSREMDWLCAATLGPPRSLWHTDLKELWHTDLRELWHTVWSQLRATFERAERSRLIKGAPANGFRVTPS